MQFSFGFSLTKTTLLIYSVTIMMVQAFIASLQITVDCGPPPVFLNGIVSYQNTTEGSEAHYRCDDGFTLEGEMAAVCRADGRWSSTPVCRQTTGSNLRYVWIINKMHTDSLILISMFNHTIDDTI